MQTKIFLLFLALFIPGLVENSYVTSFNLDSELPCTNEMKNEMNEILLKIRSVFSIIFPIDGPLLNSCSYKLTTGNNNEFHIWIPLKLEKFGKICKLIFFQKVQNPGANKIKLDLSLESRLEYDRFPESCNYTLLFESPEERAVRINSLLHMVVENVIKHFDVNLNEVMIVKLYFVSLLGAESVFNSYMARFLGNILAIELPDLDQNFRTLLGSFLSVFGKAYLQKVRERIISLLGPKARKSMMKYVVHKFDFIYQMYLAIIEKITALEENNLVITPLGTGWIEILLNHENNKMNSEDIDAIIKNIDFTINKLEEEETSQNKSFMDQDVNDKRNSVFMVKNLQGFKDYKIKFFILEMLFFRGEHYLPEPVPANEVKRKKSNCPESKKAQAKLLNLAASFAEVSDRIQKADESSIDKISQKCVRMETKEKVYFSFLVKMDGKDCELGLKYVKESQDYLDIVDTHPVFWYGISCFRLARITPPTIKF